MFQEVMDMSKKVTAKNGTEYELRFNGFYYWHRDGAVHTFLKGSYMSPTDALNKMRQYDASLEQEVVYSDDSLENLTKKSELLGYAKKNAIEIPAEHKSVGAIKKFLQGGYE